LVNGTRRQDELKFQTTIESMNLMKYHVMNLGEKEFQFELDYLKSIKSLAQFPFISANVRVGAELPFEKIFSYQADIHGKIRNIKVIGILSPSFKNDLDPSVEILDPYRCIQDLLKEVSDSDFLLLLYHGDKEGALKLVNEFPQIKVAITGHGYEEPSSETVTVNGQMILITPMRGRYVGKISLELGENDRFDVKNMDYIELNETIGASKTIETLLSEYQEILELEKIDQSMEGRNVDVGKSFVGSPACNVCHADAFRIWQNSRHPHAFESILPVKKEHDPDCLLCHSTGFKYTSGFTGKELTSHLTEVGCEACHGAGSLHVESPLAYPMLKLGVGTCVTCHDPENSPKFDFKTYWDRIKH
jgi:hypothetical protein